MKKAMLFATAAMLSAFATAVSAQDMRNHDNGTGGAGASGVGRLGGVSSVGDDPYYAAVRLIHHEKYADAIPYLDDALAQQPRNANTLSYEGFAHAKLGDYSASIDYLHRALASNPDHKAAHQYLGELYLAMHDANSANGQLTELKRICPDGCDERDTLEKEITAYGPPAGAANH